MRSATAMARARLSVIFSRGIRDFLVAGGQMDTIEVVSLVQIIRDRLRLEI